MTTVLDLNATELVEQLAALVEQMMSAPTNEQKAVLAVQAWELNHSSVGPAITQERRAAVRGLRAEGYTLQEVGDMLGVTTSRVSQIVQ